MAASDLHEPPGPAGAERDLDFGRLASAPGSQEFRAARREQPGGLAALEARVAHDLACLNYPPANWVPPRTGPDGDTPLVDVVVAGGGMCGQTAAYALRREGVARVRTIDARSEGLEGPWASFARMEILRSPKHLTGADLGVPSLTFRAWYEARFGPEGWRELHKVWRLDWRDYLLWVHRQVGVAVDNGTRLVSVEPGDACLRLRLERAGKSEIVLARKLVVALGREGSGQPRRPSFPSLDYDAPAARARVFHSMDAIDFAALAGRRVAVLGVGASAFDNAGLALEHGAAVTMFARRARLPQVNKSKWTSFAGFFRGYVALPDAQRVRFYAHIFDEQVPPPFESVLRCDRHPSFALRLGEPWLDVAADADAVRVTTHMGEHRFDTVILGTGFDVDLIDRPEIASLASHALRWSDRLDGEPASAAAAEIARFPWLGDGFELVARDGAPPEVADALGRIHWFGWGSTISHGAIAGDIPGLAIGATRLSAAIASDLFVEDADTHYANLLAHDEQELKPTRWWDRA